MFVNTVYGINEQPFVVYVLQSREERKTEAVWKMFEKMEAKGKKKLGSLSDVGGTEDGNTTPKNDNKER